MDNVSTKKTNSNPGVTAGVIPFDVEETSPQEFLHELVQKYYAWLATEFDGLVSHETLAATGKRFEQEVMVWLKPGWYINAPIYCTFHKVDTSRRKGLEVAPYQVRTECSIEFPIGQPFDYVNELRFSCQGELDLALGATFLSIIWMVKQVLLSEVITE